METTEPREDGETMRAVCDSPRHARAIIRASGAPGGLPDGCIKNQACQLKLGRYQNHSHRSKSTETLKISHFAKTDAWTAPLPFSTRTRTDPIKQVRVFRNTRLG